jgi:hypothetical protein
MSPAQQSIIDLVDLLSKVKGVIQVDIALSELEKNVEDFKVTLEGYGIDYEDIRSVINDFGAVIRNVDHVVSAGEYYSRPDNDILSASMLVLAQHHSSDLEIEKICDDFDKFLTYIKSKKGSGVVQ